MRQTTFDGIDACPDCGCQDLQKTQSQSPTMPFAVIENICLSCYKIVYTAKKSYSPNALLVSQNFIDQFIAQLNEKHSDSPLLNQPTPDRNLC